MRSVIAHSPSAILFGVSGHNKAVFFRQLATMVQAGLPVGKAVVTAGQHSLEALTAELSLLIEKHGKSMSEAMAQYPYHFNRHEVALVKAGESSGQLDRQLNELAQTAEMNWQLHKKVTSKLVYPALVAHSAVLLPPLFLLVKDGLAAYLTTVFGMLIPAYILFGLFFFFYRYSRLSGGVRRLTDHFLASVPMLGGPHQYGARIRFFQTLANLTEAGFLPSQAIPLAADSADSFWLKDKVLASYNKLGKEVPVSAVMKDSGVFKLFEQGLVVSGEESGSFASSLKKAADTLRPDYEAQIHRLTVILPVLLLFLVGGMVGVVAVRTMSDIFAPLNMF